MSKQRQKGSAYEREVAGKLSAVYPTARRGDNSKQQPDVEGTPFWLECKRRGAQDFCAPYRWMDQAVEGKQRAGDQRPPALLVRLDHQPTMVVMRLEDWMSLAAGNGIDPHLIQLGLKSIGEAQEYLGTALRGVKV